MAHIRFTRTGTATPIIGTKPPTEFDLECRIALTDPDQSLAKFLDCAQSLGDALGPVLYQLPPRWRANNPRLESFLAALPAGQRAAFEFRDTSWFDDTMFRVLERYRAALCISHLAGHTSPIELTADFLYVRLHGPGEAYQGRYGRHRLAPWAERIRSWCEQGRDVFCYFDNDQAGYAPQDAADMLSLIGDVTADETESKAG